MSYYDKNFKKFIDTTLNLDLSSLYKPFEEYLVEMGSILDLGCGSGRDIKYFRSKGYNVIGVEPSSKLARYAREYSKAEVFEYGFLDYKTDREFNGIWACASLLHLSDKDLEKAFKKIHDLLTEDGIFYCSFKYGDFEGDRNGRYFNDQTLESISKLIPSELTIIKDWITEDKRPDRDEKWLNLLVKK